MLNPPLLAFVVTRVILGVGIGLLAAGRIPDSSRQRAGITLAAIGAATTLPAVISVLRRRTTATQSAWPRLWLGGLVSCDVVHGCHA